MDWESHLNNILPRLLHPMQMIPLWTTRQIVKVTQKDFAKFICRGKRPRLKLKTLTHELHPPATLLETPVQLLVNANI